MRAIKAKTFLVFISFSALFFLAYVKLGEDWINIEDRGKNILKTWKPLTGIEMPSPNISNLSVLKNGTEISKNDRNGNRSENVLNVEKRFFEERCLTTFNESKSNLSVFSREAQNFEFLKTEEGKKYKTILVYHTSWTHNKAFDFGFGHELFNAACCKEKRCFMTNKRSIIPIEKFDAVMFQFKDFQKKNLPSKRARHQRYVLYERESPPMSGLNPQDFNGIFNWTQTYRKDSDIVAGYGVVYNKKEFSADQNFSRFENPLSLKSVMKTKRKLVVWFVSHCKTDSKREYYVKALRKYLTVDIYGRCSKLKCRGPFNVNCYRKMENEYKFYLSFENNLCRDYVSEKLYFIMNYYVIPVVRGFADYASIVPPHSFIDVKDFKTPKDLADYLIYLDKNDTAYMEYFNWRKDYIVMSKLLWLYQANNFCSLCQKLHNDKTEKVYYNFSGWFKEAAECNKDLGNF